MNRRQAIENTVAWLGAFVMSPTLLEASKHFGNIPLNGVAFDTNLVSLLDEIADTMLPTTPDSPGAKAAGAGAVMASIIKNCYTPEVGKSLDDLLLEINAKSKERFKKEFVKASFADRIKVLTPLDEEKEERYVKLKELAVFVYFTSEIGMTQALRYIEVPGSYDGCMEYKKGDKAWGWSLLSY